jgi:hypothetical protein
MMGERTVAQEALFYSFILERHVPAAHLLRSIDRFVDLSDVREHLRPFYSETGRPSIDPELLIRMLIIGYSMGIRSERRLCEEVHLNLAYRWFCRLGLEGDVPDHSTFSKNRHGRFHHDDTTVPVIAAGKTITGRVWASLRDDRPFGGKDPPSVMFYYTRDRTSAHPQRQLAHFSGILQADAYTGYDALYVPGRKPGPILEAACWAHARRPFYKEARANGSPVAREVVTRMDAIFAAEREIWGHSAEERRAFRQIRVAPLVAELGVSAPAIWAAVAQERPGQGDPLHNVTLGKLYPLRR